MGLPKDEFPSPPQLSKADRISIDQSVLDKMLKLTSFAMSHDETRYVLNGLLFKIAGGYLELIATDGRRLAVVKKKIDTPVNLTKEVIVPSKTIS